MISIEAAHHDAEVAADEAAVRIVPASTPDELDQLRRTMEGIWGPEIVPPRNLLRGMAISGNCLLVAWRNSDPVGFALGWLGWGGGIHFHSHQVGVMAGERGGGVGYALKLAQRALCLDHGVVEMRWTFDPMLLSNARFNLGRLGAVIVDFLPPSPHRVPYSHRPGLFSHKMEWQRMFTWHPAYHLLDRSYQEHRESFSFAPQERVTTDILLKATATAFPVVPLQP